MRIRKLESAADAVAFIAGAYEKINGKSKCGCGAILFLPKGYGHLDIEERLPETSENSVVLAEVNAAIDVLDYCRQMSGKRNTIKRIDIYFMDASEVFDGDLCDKFSRLDRPRYENFYRIYDACIEDGMDIRFCKVERIWMDYFDLEPDLKLAEEHSPEVMENMNPETVYSLIAEGLAIAVAGIEYDLEDGGPDLEDVRADLNRTVEYKNVYTQYVKKTEQYLYRPKKTADNSKTMMGLIFSLAKSIRKNKMTTMHMLYGYACFCLMDAGQICRMIDRDPADLKRIVYTQKKLLEFFNADRVLIEPSLVKEIIPKYMEEYEQIDGVGETYDELLKCYNEDKKKHYPDDVIVYDILSNLLCNPAGFGIDKIYHQFFTRNKSWKFGNGKLQSIQIQNGSLEQIVSESNVLYESLTDRVYGQTAAVQKFVRGITNFRLSGKNRKEKPAASFLFAGPPGVGKSYLAKLAAEELRLPVKVFDMSEYAGHESERGLIGFEYSYKNARPGVLTSYVEENPSCVLIIDEIEKADVGTKLVFLQILDGARLEDKYTERKVNFENVILIFTTNCGKALYQYNEDADLSLIPEQNLLSALKEDDQFPDELCSRFAAGSIILFNFLKPKHLIRIIRAKFDETAAELFERYQMKITYEDRLPELFLLHTGAGNDARVIAGKSGEFLKDEVVAFAKEYIDRGQRLSQCELMIRMELNPKDQTVYPLMIPEKKTEVLFVTNRKDALFRVPGVCIVRAGNPQKILTVLREKHIAAAVVDLNYGIKGERQGSNAFGVNSTGMESFELIRKKVPQLPVYLLDHDYGAEDKKEIYCRGVHEIIYDLPDNAQKILTEIVSWAHIQKSMDMLARKGQMIDYRVRRSWSGNRGCIELCHLNLRDAQDADAQLRCTAGKSKIFEYERPTLKFDDIVGAERAKKNLRHFIRYIENIDRYRIVGAEAPRGVLLYGPAGTGKTSLAKAFAGESDALFLNTTGANLRSADNPVKAIQDLFKIAHQNAPAIIFIDEIDVIAKQRNGHDTGTELLVNTLLTEMEGFKDQNPLKPVFVVAATNFDIQARTGDPFEMVIDPAVVRRFDNALYVGLPSREERRDYVRRLLEQKGYRKNISDSALEYLSQHTGGKSLSFLHQVISNMVNDSIDHQEKVSNELLVRTLETQIYGDQKQTDEAYRLEAARHEAGHAYVSWKLGKIPKFITVGARGNQGGYVSYGDGEEVYNLSKSDYLDLICSLLAGRAAEVHFYQDKGINTGASSDLKKATNAAISMICYYGMGSLGLIALDPQELLKSSKAQDILAEAGQILDSQMDRARSLIKAGEHCINKIVEVLLDQTYIQGDELLRILQQNDTDVYLEHAYAS